MTNKSALVVMAAGMGSRFGGVKQIAPMGPNGEIIIDFSVHDAVKSGFSKAVFIIKKEIEILKPTHVVFVTDTWWMEPADYTDASFAKELGVTLTSNSTNTIVGQGTYLGAKLVVTKRPETAKTARADHAQQIIDTFSSLSP